ncbi:MAG: hypothetical protein FJ279_38560, partial [Planctomycetes bacterium]|nr:hypothetical protein [Planctomycetota bacterium]
QRCVAYQKAADLSAVPGTAQAGVSAELRSALDVEKKLDELYQTYGRLFVARNEAGLGEFDRAAASLAEQATLARRRVAERFSALRSEAKQAAGDWPALPEPSPKPLALAPNGQPNQILIGTRSPFTHFGLEEPLTINKLHSLSMLYDMPDQKEPGKYAPKVTFDLWQKLKDAGATHASIATAFALHDKQMAPAWFLEKLRDDPDLLMASADGAKLKPPDKYAASLNIWRPEVRQMTADLVAGVAGAFRDQPQFPFYVTSAENIGPYFACEVGVRSTGYNPSALPDFHAWLKGRYKDISDLNRQWKATYARFEDIQPPQDLCLAGEWKRPHPLGYEFQSWREDRHVAWLKLIYDAFKKADPAKPVLADHSGVLRSVDGSRLFDTCDILSVHMRSPHFMLASIYTYSMNRFARKQLGQYECFWGCQEDLPRIAEEKAQRCAMMKYLYRLTIWGRHLQIWWYAYTSADYLLSYNGNWFNPVYDLTTLRYCAAALPVGKAKVKRLEDVFLNSS